MNISRTGIPKFYLIIFTILMTFVVSAFAMDLDCLLDECHHGNEGKGPCHIERNLISSSNNLDNSRLCDNASLSPVAVSIVPDLTVVTLPDTAPKQLQNKPALSLAFLRAPPFPVS